MRLADIRRLDARGGWRGGSPGASATLDTRLVSERGQWRIDNPPDALVVPTSFFDRSFARFNLYFYDQTGRTLLPDPVFIPRGEQTATNLVRGLLTGAGRGLAQVTRSALPSRTDLDLSVVVTESGVAEVPLSREILQVSVNELDRAADQLAWTLRQVPGITRVRITVAGAPVPLRGGQIDVPVTSGEEFDAGGSPTAQLWALRGGRVVDVSSAEPEPVDSPLGKPGYSHAKSRRERVAAPDRRGLRQRQDRVRRLRGRRVDEGLASCRRRHRRAAPAVRHVRRPLAGGPYAERGARARRRRGGEAAQCGFPV